MALVVKYHGQCGCQSSWMRLVQCLTSRDRTEEMPAEFELLDRNGEGGGREKTVRLNRSMGILRGQFKRLKILLNLV